MRFGPTPLAEAEGAILAHSVKLTTRSLKKGRRLTLEDISELAGGGFPNPICAVLEPDDVHEDIAADRLAGRVLGPGLNASSAFTGRANLYAEEAGVVVYDPGSVQAFNQVDERITLGLVPPYQAVDKGQMVATLKIIPFSAPEAAVRKAEDAAGNELIALKAFKRTKVGFVQSRLSGTKESVLDKTSDVTAARLEHAGSEIAREVRCAHDEEAVAAAIAQTLAEDKPGLILISGASAVVDRRDVIPAAIEKAGGEIVQFGMPVDPGNLLLVARIGDVPVLGMPGCARSPKLNGFDWVLQRVLAGIEVQPNDLMAMGVGGMLKDVPNRPLPRAQARRAAAEAARSPTMAPRIAAVVLAAGQSRRMGPTNKLLAEIDGVPMVRRTVENIARSKITEIVAVTGHEPDQVAAALAGTPADFVHNPDFADGLSTSLKIGLAQLGEEIDGAIICLGDMPNVDPRIIDRLIAAYDPLEGRAICVPTRGGKRGNPVLWDRRFFEEMGELAGDVGARHMIGEYGEMVVEVESDDDGVLLDIDTPDALAEYTRNAGGGQVA